MLSFALLLLSTNVPSEWLYRASDLLARCTSGFAADEGRCRGYISGVYDTVRAYEEWQSAREICTPSKVTDLELRNTFVDFVSSHPDDLQAQAASVVVLALRDKFSCRGAPRIRQPPKIGP